MACFVSVLDQLGWGPFFSAQLPNLNLPGPSAPGEASARTVAARVVEEQKRYHFVTTALGTRLARIAGKLRHAARSRADLPAVGDFVLVEERASDNTATITHVLERRTKLSRKEPGTDDEQVLAANVDVALVVHGLDVEPNHRRLERFLATAARGGVKPIVVLSKADLCAPTAVAEATAEVQQLAPGTTVMALSARQGQGLSALWDHMGPGTTAVVVGPSGAGKSTLVNHLAGAELGAVSEVRESDAKGRHTTTARTLFTLRDGTLLIDTPGIREIEPWDAAPGLDDVFADVAGVATACRFRDCTHEREPGCAVREAVAEGRLVAERYQSFQKLQAEARAQRERQSPWLKPRRP